MASNAEMVVGGCVVALFGLGLAFGVFAGLAALLCWVVNEIWPQVALTFWPAFGGMVLLAVIGSFFRSSK